MSEEIEKQIWNMLRDNEQYTEVIKTLNKSNIKPDKHRYIVNYIWELQGRLKELQQENQQLKEALENLEEINNDKSNLIVEDMKELLKYKSVLDEIREYIKEYIREDAEYSNYMEMKKENYNELLQILDKVKENERGMDSNI